MNRRDLLKLLAPGIAAGLIVPELLLPKRTFFLPPAGGWAHIPMTATEVRERTRLMWEAIAAMQLDLMAFGTGAISVDAVLGELVKVRHVPAHMLRANFDFTDALSTPVTHRTGLPQKLLDAIA